MDSYVEEFFIGQRDLIDLLDAKSELNSAKNRHAEAYFDALSARYRVLEGLGDLFQGVGLVPEVSETGFKMSKLDSDQLDGLPLSDDIDQDGKSDNADHCDNSKAEQAVNPYGCAQTLVLASADKTANSRPIAVNDQWQLPQNGIIHLTPLMLLNNDSDADGDSLKVSILTSPANGFLAPNQKGGWVYRAAEGFTGIDTFDYEISDGQAKSTATVSIEIVLDTENSVDISSKQYVNFMFGTMELTPESRDRVQKIVSRLLQEENVRVHVTAHTDNIGSEKYNQQLSEKRAKAVRSLLMLLGIEGYRITASGRGESAPIADNNTEVGRAINRRGEFEFDHSSFEK